MNLLVGLVLFRGRSSLAVVAVAVGVEAAVVPSVAGVVVAAVVVEHRSGGSTSCCWCSR
jgi:hypothetical protein